MNRQVLCVDDEPNVLSGIERSLRGADFEVHTANSGKTALRTIQERGPFALVVTDMRMPEMDGVELLTHVKEQCPDTVRIMLTGNHDQETAINAVNKGSIFRFLNKPCGKEELKNAVQAGLEYFRLREAEKELLEGTLKRSIQVLVDVLSIVNPTAFRRTNGIKALAKDIAEDLGLENPWMIESAAMLSQLGCIAVPEDILQRVDEGLPIDSSQLALYQNHPSVAKELLEQIPRLETVAAIVANQQARYRDDDSSDKSRNEVIGARILKAVIDYDKKIDLGFSKDDALGQITSRDDWYDPDVIASLISVVRQQKNEYVTREVKISDLRPGMILDRPVISGSNTLVFPEGQEINSMIIMRLEGFVTAGVINDCVFVRERVDD